MYISTQRIRTPTPTPAPIPAFAPVDRGCEDEVEDSDEGVVVVPVAEELDTGSEEEVLLELGGVDVVPWNADVLDCSLVLLGLLDVLEVTDATLELAEDAVLELPSRGTPAAEQ